MPWCVEQAFQASIVLCTQVVWDSAFIENTQELSFRQDRHAQRLCLRALRASILSADHIARLLRDAA